MSCSRLIPTRVIGMVQVFAPGYRLEISSRAEGFVACPGARITTRTSEVLCASAKASPMARLDCTVDGAAPPVG